MMEGGKAAEASKQPRFEWLNGTPFAVFLTVLIAATFPYIVTGFKAFACGDAGQFSYPLAFYTRESYLRGEIPFWNPLNSCGIPFLAQWNTMTLYPPSLFYFLLPVPWSFDVFCLAHLVLAGAGMYRLAHHFTGNRTGAALAGLVFAFNGLTWYGVMWPSILAALGWMPWIILAMERARQDGGKFIPFAALAAGMQLLSGGVEVIIQTWMAAGVLWLCGAFKNRELLGKSVIRGLSPVLLGAGLAMMQLLPFLELLGRTQRSTAFANTSYGQIATMPLSGWADYLVPLFHCHSNVNGVFVQTNWTGSYYLGVGVLALALLAVLRVRDTRVRLLFGLALFGFIMALGSAGFLQTVLVRLLPVLGFIRFPVKYVVLPTFALPLLAGFGAARLAGATPQKWHAEWKWTQGVALGLLALTIGIVCYDKFNPGTDDPDDVLINAAVRCLWLAAAIACVPFIRQGENVRTQRIAQAALLLCAWFDVLTHLPNLSPTVSTSAWQPDAIRQSFQWDDQMRAGDSRAMRSKFTFWKMFTGGSLDPNTDLHGRRLSLFMDMNLLDHVPKFDGFYPLDVKQYLDVFKHAYFTTNDAAGLLDFLGVSEIGNPTNVFAWVPRQTFHPLITAGQQPVYLDDDHALDAIFSDNFNSSRTVYLPAETKSVVQANQAPNSAILSPQFQAGRLKFGVKSDNAALVVVAQTFYPAWHAYVDGKETPVWRANYAFQALEVPAGQHEVALIYQDRLFSVGTLVSSISLLGCIGAWLWLRAPSKHLG
jgi:hypothetical protein